LSKLILKSFMCWGVNLSRDLFLPRIHLFEFEDQSWCPESIRDGLTDSMQFFVNFGGHYRHIIKHIARVLRFSKTRRIIDLGSGGGGPWIKLYRFLEEEENISVEICLTDKYPNIDALSWAQKASNNKICYHPKLVDSMQVPVELKGFRTLFSSFHHFPPNQARAILADAVKKGQGIGVFEFLMRTPFALLFMCFAPIAIFIMTPFIRPFKWSRLIWTYLIPILPFLACFDGIISCLRTYSPLELKELTKGLSDYEYKWEIGYESAFPSPFPVTYLIGYPAREKNSE
jgi:hypothetical protein